MAFDIHRMQIIKSRDHEHSCFCLNWFPIGRHSRG